jgi:hypothetical protein
MNHLQSGKARLPVGKRIAGAGNADNRNIVDFFQYRAELVQGLKRGENHAGNAGPAFVDAVVLAVAEVALDIAFFRHREMYAPRAVPDPGIKTRMFELVPKPGWFWDKLLEKPVRARFFH